MISGGGTALRLRLLGRRVLATMLCLLRLWAGKRLAAGRAGPPGGNLGRGTFRLKNVELQEELGRLFAPYHRFCPECGSQCCREGEIPCSELDALLYGGPRAWQSHLLPDPIRESGDRPQFWSCFSSQHLYRKLKQFSPARPRTAADRGVFCPALGDAGCTLPWGERPVICVFCACPQILRAMDWGDYGRYIRINLKYLTHLTRSLQAGGSELTLKDKL
jgi:hypothetical protein